MTKNDLDRLEAAYASGVLEVREAETWVKYQSMKEMRLAILEAKTEIASTAPMGARIFNVTSGY